MENQPDIYNNNILNNSGELGNGASVNDSKKYIEFEFSDFQNEKNSFLFMFESPKKAYIIDKNQYGQIKHKNNEDNNNIIENCNCKFYYKKEELDNLIINNIEFCFVNEQFLKDFNIAKNSYENKHIYFYKKDNIINILYLNEKLDNINETKDNLSADEISQLLYGEGTSIINKSLNTKNFNSFHYNEANNNDVIDKEQKEKILKQLILLYAFEKYFLQTFNKSIKDEYDMNEFYLINLNWMKIYKTEFLFQQVSKIINDMNLKYSYKGFIINLEKIVKHQNFYQIQDSINLLNNGRNDYLIKEKNFFPELKKEQLYQGSNISYPNNFVLIPEKIFDLFYEEIKNPQHKKEDYKFNALIGDSILFIQNKQYNNIFFCYLLSDENKFEIYYLFNYNEEHTFYNEVNNYIKDQGLVNYLFSRNININGNTGLNDIFSEQNKIVQYIDYKEISPNLIIKEVAKREFKQNQKLYVDYNKFIKHLYGLKDNKSIVTKINDLNSIQYIYHAFVILNSDLEQFEKILFFEEIKDLSKFHTKEEFKNKEKEIINSLIKEKTQEKIKKFITNLTIFNSENIDININNNVKFSLIDKSLLSKINNSAQYLNHLNSLEEATFFINNNDYFVFYEKSQSLYRLKFKGDNQNKFSLIEMELESEFKELLKLLKKLYESENKIKDNITLFPLNNISKPKPYCLVNYNNWTNYFKKVFKYELIVSKGNEKKILSLLKKEKHSNDLQFLNNLYPNYNNLQNFNVPFHFELVDVNLFVSILQQIRQIYGINLNYNNIYNVSFGDNKIFIQDNSNNKLYFIYSNNNNQFEYLIKFVHNYDLISYLAQKSSNGQTFEEFISYFGINLNETNIQYILDDNLSVLGQFLNFSQKPNAARREPNHCLGLENIGATCYMNATIQCLCHVLNMKKYFQNKQLVYNDINNKHCPLTIEFYKVINHLWKKTYHGKNYYAPRDFKDKISEMNPLFKGIAANDSKDLIIFLYETIHNEINNPNPYFQNNNNFNNFQNNELLMFRQNYYSKNSSFLINTFYFEQQSLLHCFNCGFDKFSYNITNIIIFPLEKVREYMIKKSPNGFASVTLENCFQNYQEPDILGGANQIYCNNCKQMSNASTANQIFTVPQVITIILNRGKGLEFDVNFEYPLFLNMDNYIVDKSSVNNNYELICVLTHLGPSGMAGHFIAFCKSPTNGKWYCYNDADVSEIDDPRYQDNDEIEGIPYVLYYQKINPNSSYPNNDINNINNSLNTITLYFCYNDKELYLDLKTDIKVKDIIKKLNKEYKIPKKVLLYYEFGTELKEMENSRTINDYNLRNQTKITILDN